MDNQNEARYKMTTNERKQYFKEYYLKSKEEKKDKKPKEVKTPKKRGRPKKIIPPFKITRFEKPITIEW
tara:strand:+ start:1879 stop:2085 length:207 start_codon:yes stop_codon:yes gene_type:complete